MNVTREEIRQVLLENAKHPQGRSGRYQAVINFLTFKETPTSMCEKILSDLESYVEY